MNERNPHAGTPFTTDDDTIAALLPDVNIPALMCSLVHMTGDPTWIRGDIKPQSAPALEFDGGLPEEVKAEARRRALPAIATYRDRGCRPHELPRPLIEEMMGYLFMAPVRPEAADMLYEDLHLDGADSGAPSWGNIISDPVKAESLTVVIGCGESGILAGIRLRQAGIPFVILEKNPGPGGTWYANRYPGARVDVGSHHYCYSFEPSDHWSQYYCRQPELAEYFARIVDKYQLGQHIRFSTEARSLVWDDNRSRWTVQVRSADGATDTIDARFVISAVGALSAPKLPDIPGMETFAGQSFHSARWPVHLDLTGTRFALIGAGATGFQIVPAVADQVAELTIFQRTPQWMLPNPAYTRTVPPGDTWAMRHLPFYGRWYRFMMIYPGIHPGIEPYVIEPDFDPDGHTINQTNAFIRQILTDFITTALDGRPDLIEKSVPPYPPMAKRILHDDGSWLRTLTKPNVELVTAGIDEIVEQGIRTADGRLHEADIICYATGFKHVQYLSSMQITGRRGASIHEQFGEEPTAYLGITVPNFPNLFLLYGPGTNLVQGASILFHSECQVNYTMSTIHRVLAAGARSVEVRKDVHDDYAERYQGAISRLVWAHPAVKHSHFKNRDGRVFTLSPWPMDVYWRWTRNANLDDFELS